MMSNCTSPSNCSVDPLAPSLVDMCNATQFVTFLSLLNELVLSNSKISGRCERVEPIETPDEEYDFVVVGGGGAGSVVAARLSENPRWKVLLLEAGPDEPAGGQVPMFVGRFSNTRVDWQYQTTNESYTCQESNGTCSLSTAKMLGGGTAHNAMLYLRGVPKDYDNWADQENDGWTWEEVKPFFIKGEDNGEIDRVGTEYHGTGGPLGVDRPRYLTPFANACLAAVAEANYGLTEDLNGAQITGFTIHQKTNKDGVRQSSSRAYLWPARNRTNLHVSINSLVTRVVIDNDTAVGVEYFKDGELKTVLASREVVVSAGSIKSPQVLLLSGIGPKEHLESMDVEVVKDLPGVGENYHDHAACEVRFTIDEPDVYDNDYDVAAQYLANQTGPLSDVGLIAVGGRLSTKSAHQDFPNVQLNFGGYTGGCAPGEVGALQSDGKRDVVIHVTNLHPESRGRVSLSSNDPFESPVIWSNSLSVTSDLDVLVDGAELALALADTEAMKAHNLTLATGLVEACSNHTFPSREYWYCALRQVKVPDNHPAGSCKMGPSSDPMAVVDPRLRVHGIKGLRVADNSIMPQITSGNTAAPAMMIGERAADFIKIDWGL